MLGHGQGQSLARSQRVPIPADEGPFQDLSSLKCQPCPVTPGRVHLGVFPQCRLNTFKGVIQTRPVIQSEGLETMPLLLLGFISSPTFWSSVKLCHQGVARGTICVSGPLVLSGYCE